MKPERESVDDLWQETFAIGREIAKVLDNKGVRPVLDPQAWNKIHNIIFEGLKRARD